MQLRLVFSQFPLVNLTHSLVDNGLRIPSGRLHHLLLFHFYHPLHAFLEILPQLVLPQFRALSGPCSVHWCLVNYSWLLLIDLGQLFLQTAEIL